MLSKFNKFISTCKAVVNNSFFAQGLPLLILCVGGSFALVIAQEIKVAHYEERKSIEPLKQLGLIKKVDLNAEYEKIKDLQYDNIRTPRPYEDNEEWEAKKEKQVERVQKLIEKTK